MRIIIGGKDIHLVDRDVKLAKRLCRKFLKAAKDRAEAQGAPIFYFTLLVVMYLMANDYIRAITPETLSLLLNAAHQNESLRLDEIDRMLQETK